MEKEKKIRQVKTIKRFYNTLRSEINFLISEKKTFEVSFTSYTASIKIAGDKHLYFYTKDGKRNDFSLFSKLKAEIKKSNLHIDGVRTEHIKYFSLTGLKDCKHKKIYNVDITDCYPTMLKNMGFISNEFYLALKEVEKIKKLRTIGQIATKKTIYQYNNGEVHNVYIKENEYLRNIWFAICQEAGEIINRCKKECPSFLFFWFDGIYFKNKKDEIKIMQILDEANCKYKAETMNNFIVKRNDRILKINYNKQNGTPKAFNLPIETKH